LSAIALLYFENWLSSIRSKPVKVPFRVRQACPELAEKPVLSGAEGLTTNGI
jgi:hypothetical protein